jgi:hypothetical protein
MNFVVVSMIQTRERERGSSHKMRKCILDAINSFCRQTQAMNYRWGFEWRWSRLWGYRQSTLLPRIPFLKLLPQLASSFLTDSLSLSPDLLPVLLILSDGEDGAHNMQTVTVNRRRIRSSCSFRFWKRPEASFPQNFSLLFLSLFFFQTWKNGRKAWFRIENLEEKLCQSFSLNRMRHYRPELMESQTQ